MAAVSNSTLQPFNCKLCLSPAENIFTINECKCQFCVDCMRMYVEFQIRDGSVYPLTCPDGACRRGGALSADEVLSLVDTATFQRYSKLRHEREVSLDPSRCFCPGPDCGAECVVPVLGARRTTNRNARNTSRTRPPKSRFPLRLLRTQPTVVHCQQCGRRFCSLCKGEWHPGQNCVEANSSSSLERTGIPFGRVDTDARVKRCPFCLVPVERDEGCAQILCRQCGHMFCWWCLEPLDNDLFLRHYDRGPCRDRLGHSRRTLYLYRFKLGLCIAGIGCCLVLLLPLLLLCLPCLVLYACVRVCVRGSSSPSQDARRSQPPQSSTSGLPAPGLTLHVGGERSSNSVQTIQPQSLSTLSLPGDSPSHSHFDTAFNQQPQQLHRHSEQNLNTLPTWSQVARRTEERHSLGEPASASASVSHNVPIPIETCASSCGVYDPPLQAAGTSPLCDTPPVATSTPPPPVSAENSVDDSGSGASNVRSLIDNGSSHATGRAYLFNHVENLDYSEVQDRVMLTGNHLVRDVACRVCETKLGWMYEFAVEESQRYKEGHVILERALVTENEDLVEDRGGQAASDAGMGSAVALDSATGSGTPTSSEPEPTPITASAAAAVLYAIEHSSR